MEIPENFGDLDGTQICNKDTILQELDAFLKRSPSVEYILVRPLSSINLLCTNVGTHYNSYGHAAVRYFYKGKWYLMNIIGKEEENGVNMVTFSDPSDYFFSTKYDKNVGCSQQRGLYNRSMIGIRIYDVPENKIEQMHKFFINLAKQNENGDAGFIILPQIAPIYSFFNKTICDKPTPKLGNCAYWTSKGLLAAGLVTDYSNWPKSTFINILENSSYDVDVVSYRRIEHAKLSYGIKSSPLEFVAPFNTFRSWFYLYPENFAKAIVHVPPDSIKAEIMEHEPIQFRSPLRNIFNGKVLVTSSIILSSFASWKASRFVWGFARMFRKIK